MKKIIKFLIALSIGVSLFWFVMRRAGWEKLNEALTLFLSSKGLIIVLLTLIIAAISILRWKLILRAQGLDARVKDLGKLWSVGFAVSYLSPVALFGGEAFRIYLTKKKLNFSWEKSAASVAIDKILDGTLFLMFLIVGILAFLFYGYFPSRMMAWLVALIILGLSGLSLFFYFKAMNRESVLEWFLKLFGVRKEKIKNTKNGKIIFDTEKEVIQFFSPKKKAFWKGLGLSFLRYFLLFLRAALLIFFLKEGIEVTRVLAIYGFTNLALLFPLPAGLGSLEAASAFSFGTLGLGFGTGTIFGMVWRGADLFLCAIGLVFLVKFGADLAEVKILQFIDGLKKLK
ncbi:flippase-like domain-containing protein [bacterium]|nr:flippase-like domain-containing protein [bacterium]